MSIMNFRFLAKKSSFTKLVSGFSDLF